MKPLNEETAQRNISFFGQIATVCPFTLCCISYDFCQSGANKETVWHCYRSTKSKKGVKGGCKAQGVIVTHTTVFSEI